MIDAWEQVRRPATRGDSHLQISGLIHGGMAAAMRKVNSQFGSGWQGLYNAIIGVYNSDDPRAKLKRFQKTIWQDPARRYLLEQEIESKQREARLQLASINTLGPLALHDEEYGTWEGLNQGTKKDLHYVTLNKDEYELKAEDADTLLIKKRGLLGTPTGKAVSIRLAGIDAPEVESHDSDPMSPVRIAGGQPYGKNAGERFQEILDSQDNITIIFDPEDETYGRAVGVVYDEQGQNINLRLVGEGSASYLPFGRAEQSIIDRRNFYKKWNEAIETEKGMWGHAFWQAQQKVDKRAGKHTTFNTYTLMNRLAEDKTQAEIMFSLWDIEAKGYMTTEDLSVFESLGNLSRGGHNRAAFSGHQSNRNTLEGLSHKGWAQGMRKGMTEFGSGWRGISSISIELSQRLALGKGSKGLSFLLPTLKKRLSEVDVKQGSKLQEEVSSLFSSIFEAEKSGFNTFSLIRKDLRGEELRQIIAHERVHQKVREHFWSQPRKRTGAREETFLEGFVKDADISEIIEDAWRWNTKTRNSTESGIAAHHEFLALVGQEQERGFIFGGYPQFRKELRSEGVSSQIKGFLLSFFRKNKDSFQTYPEPIRRAAKTAAEELNKLPPLPGGLGVRKTLLEKPIKRRMNLLGNDPEKIRRQNLLRKTNLRKQKMSRLQKDAALRMLKSPIGHSKGGS